MIEKTGFIYKIENLLNGNLYVGSTIQKIEKRWDDHKNALIGNYHCNNHLQNAWSKYGEENFIFEVVEDNVPLDMVLEREQHYLDTWLEAQEYIRGEKSIFLVKGYNLAPIAGSTYGWKANKKQKRENSDRLKKMWQNEEYRLKQMRVRSSKESREKRSKMIRELHRTTDIAKKISEGVRTTFKENPEKKEQWMGKVHSEENKKKRADGIRRKLNEDPSYRDNLIKSANRTAKVRSKKMSKNWEEGSEYQKKQMKIRASKENKKKQSEGLRDYYKSLGKEKLPQNKRVGLFDPKTNELKMEFYSLKSAGEYFAPCNPRNGILKYPEPFRGYIWKYI